VKLQGRTQDAETDEPFVNQTPSPARGADESADDECLPFEVKLRPKPGRAVLAAGDDEHQGLAFLDSIVASAENWALCTFLAPRVKRRGSPFLAVGWRLKYFDPLLALLFPIYS
jgi:hypothetical protein